MALINTTTTGILGTTVYGDGQGALTVQRDGVTQAIVTNGPAFSVYMGSTQSLSNITTTKVQFTIKEYDTANCFDTANYRFTPNVAGYYQFNFWLNAGSSSTSRWIAWMFKNGSNYKVIGDDNSTTPNCLVCSSTIAYANGTTDYFEIYSYISGTSPAIYGNASIPSASRFDGHLFKAV